MTRRHSLDPEHILRESMREDDSPRSSQRSPSECSSNPRLQRRSQGGTVNRGESYHEKIQAHSHGNKVNWKKTIGESKPDSEIEQDYITQIFKQLRKKPTVAPLSRDQQYLAQNKPRLQQQLASQVKEKDKPHPVTKKIEKSKGKELPKPQTQQKVAFPKQTTVLGTPTFNSRHIRKLSDYDKEQTEDHTNAQYQKKIGEKVVNASAFSKPDGNKQTVIVLNKAARDFHDQRTKESQQALKTKNPVAYNVPTDQRNYKSLMVESDGKPSPKYTVGIPKSYRVNAVDIDQHGTQTITRSGEHVVPAHLIDHNSQTRPFSPTLSHKKR